jgi:hypothetical protein
MEVSPLENMMTKTTLFIGGALLLVCGRVSAAPLLPFSTSIYGEAAAQAGFHSARDWRLRCPPVYASACPTTALSWDGEARLDVSDVSVDPVPARSYALHRTADGSFSSRVESGEIKSSAATSVTWSDAYVEPPSGLQTVAANAYVSTSIEDYVMFVPTDGIAPGPVGFRLTLSLDASVDLDGLATCNDSGASAFAEAIFGNTGSHYVAVTDTIDTCPATPPPGRQLVQEGSFEAGVAFRFFQQLIVSASINMNAFASGKSGSSGAFSDASHTLAPLFEILTPGYTYVTSSGFVYDGSGTDTPTVPGPGSASLVLLGLAASVARRYWRQ